MTDDRSYPAGVPCWVDTDQPDVGAARRFYEDLFGWTFTDAMPPDAPGTYLIATLGGEDVAAIGPAEAGAGAQWNTYIAVDDADAVAASVCAAGGTLELDPVDAGPGGRLAACADPRGARFRLWQPRRRLGAQLVNVPGSWNFSDLHTGDPAAAADFYALFGWEFDDVGFATMIRRPGYGDHLEATVDPGIRERQAGVSAPPGFEDAIAWLAPQADGVSDHWAVTFTVANRDESASLAESLGATAVSSEDTEWTKIALVRDPQGAVFTLSQFTPPQG